jgi:hypothetical protein
MTTYTANSVNDTAGLRAAMLAAAGGVLEIVGSPRLVADSCDELLLWDRPLHIKATAPLTVLRVAADTPAIPALRIRPAAGQGPANWAIEGIGIFPESGHPGGDAIVIEKDPAGYGLAHFNARRCMTNGLGGYAVRVIADGTTEGNAFFNSVFEGGAFAGQAGALSLINCGDSLVFKDLWLHGPGRGIDAENISGAAQCVFDNLSNTAEGGAAYLRKCNQLKIRDMQSEQVGAYTGSDDAMVVFDDCIGCEVTGSNMNTHGHVRGVLFKAGSRWNKIATSTIAVFSATPKVHAHFDAGAGAGNALGPDNIYTVDGVDKIDPWLSGSHASPQFGIWTGVPLSGGWAAHADTNYYQGLQCQLSADRGVLLRGTLDGGTNAVGTVIGTLPIGARPSWKTVRVTVRCKNAVWSDGQVEINSAGQIKIAQAFPAPGLVSFDGARFATY